MSITYCYWSCSLQLTITMVWAGENRPPLVYDHRSANQLKCSHVLCVWDNTFIFCIVLSGYSCAKIWLQTYAWNASQIVTSIGLKKRHAVVKATAFLTGPTCFPSTVVASVIPLLHRSTRFSWVRDSAYCTHQEIPAIYGTWNLIAKVKGAHQWILCSSGITFKLQFKYNAFKIKGFIKIYDTTVLDLTFMNPCIVIQL